MAPKPSCLLSIQGPGCVGGFGVCEVTFLQQPALLLALDVVLSLVMI